MIRSALIVAIVLTGHLPAQAFEGRYRTLSEKADGAPSLDRALIEVERTGRLAGEGEDLAARASSGSVVSILREFVADQDIQAALYVRGATALVQGPKGATAERTARAVRSILGSTRSAGRRLGLGQPFQIQLEGSFGTLSKAIERGGHGALADAVATSIGIVKTGFAYRAKALVYLRNRCANHSRLWHHSVIDAGPTPNNVRKKAKRIAGQFEPRSVLDVIASLDDMAARADVARESGSTSLRSTKFSPDVMACACGQ